MAQNPATRWNGWLKVKDMIETALYWYAAIFSALFVLSPIGKLALKIAGKYEATPKPVQIEELLTLPFLIVSIFALYGYVEKQAFFFALFWQGYFFLLMLMLFVSFWFPKQQWLRRELPLKKFVIFNVVGLVIMLPYYFMIFHYAFIAFPQA